MNSPDLTLFWIAFFAYLAGFLFYSLFLAFKNEIFAKLGLYAMIAGFFPQTAAFIVRWILVDHVPLSNMYEYMALMSWMAVLSLFIILYRYKKPIFGSFIAPAVFMLMVTASMLPKDISQALMPALQSYWLTIHVTLAALGSGSFAVACAVSFVYLLKKSSENEGNIFESNKSVSIAVFSTLIFPVIFTFFGKLAGFLPEQSEFIVTLGDSSVRNLGWLASGLGLALPISAILWTVLYGYSTKGKEGQKHGIALFTLSIISILIAGLVSGFIVKSGIVQLSQKSAWKIFEFLSVIWVSAVIVFFPIYFLVGKRAFVFLRNLKINTDLLDEINYKTVSLGYPLYTVGALFAGAIWAEQAWGQFWGWDPKEVGALIIWLFYSGFLHARRQYNWRGNRAAILSVFGLLMILLSFFGNYFFGGQHAYT